MDTLHKRGRPFAVGNRSGKGRPVGSRNKATLLLKEMMEGEAPAVGRKLIELVQKGVMPAIKMYMDRMYPLQRERPVHLDLPDMTTADDVTTAQGIIIKQVALGNITPTEGERLARLVELQRKAMETQKLCAMEPENQRDVQPDPRLDARLDILTDDELEQLERLLHKASQPGDGPSEAARPAPA